MGASQSTASTNNWKGAPVGYHVLKVQDNSPGSKSGLEPFFDFIVSINGIRLLQDDDVFKTTLKNNLDRPVELELYNAKQQGSRKVILIPSSSWGGQGLLGVSIRFCSFEGANQNVWHVLDVHPGSPASTAQLNAYSDYIIGADTLLKESEDLYAVVEVHDKKPLKLYVYNTDTDTCREVTIVPNRDWGGEGSLGCDIGFGYLHRIPYVTKGGTNGDHQAGPLPAKSSCGHDHGPGGHDHHHDHSHDHGHSQEHTHGPGCDHSHEHSHDHSHGHSHDHIHDHRHQPSPPYTTPTFPILQPEVVHPKAEEAKTAAQSRSAPHVHADGSTCSGHHGHSHDHSHGPFHDPGQQASSGVSGGVQQMLPTSTLPYSIPPYSLNGQSPAGMSQSMGFVTGNQAMKNDYAATSSTTSPGSNAFSSSATSSVSSDHQRLPPVTMIPAPANSAASSPPQIPFQPAVHQASHDITSGFNNSTLAHPHGIVSSSGGQTMQQQFYPQQHAQQQMPYRPMTASFPVSVSGFPPITVASPLPDQPILTNSVLSAFEPSTATAPATNLPPFFYQAPPQTVNNQNSSTTYPQQMY
ncbi:hypothetical protein RvY_16586 [Ramazzottius varieornatus]|uniref:PDZ GRASP-type domain-containing protein n=1 Tax=Ramazzottius varieornatus TaxID=947166 RepID=A0A1D1VZ14_RAMVA|nr:hypothetical protein RvY_16586 [Ramazzottius varieornatus]